MPKTDEELLKKWRKVFIEWNRNPDGEPLDEMAEKFWWDVLAEQRKEWVESVRREIVDWTPSKLRQLEGQGVMRITIDDHKRNLSREILSLPSLTTDSEECGALIHTRGFDGKGALYCAEKKPCKVHSK